MPAPPAQALLPTEHRGPHRLPASRGSSRRLPACSSWHGDLPAPYATPRQVSLPLADSTGSLQAHTPDRRAKPQAHSTSGEVVEALLGAAFAFLRAVNVCRVEELDLLLKGA